jgi:uncharacterized protein YbaP (TraB family)
MLFDVIRRTILTLAAGLPLAAPAAAATPDFSLNGETLAWRLEPPGGGAPSYLVGTIHAVDDRLRPAIDRATGLLEEAGALVVEVELGDGAQLDLINAMLLRDGRTLPGIIGDDLFRQLVAIGRNYDLPAEFLGNLAPWGAALMISIPVEQTERMASGTPVFDQALIDRADAAGLPVATLETVEEQIAAFAGHPEPDQIAMLVQAVEMYPRLDEMVEEMIARYVEDDLAALAEVALREMQTGDEGLNQRVLDLLIVERNRRMAERLLPLIEARPYLVAIGALHLPGEEGVLNLLARQGWTVTPADSRPRKRIR